MSVDPQQEIREMPPVLRERGTELVGEAPTAAMRLEKWIASPWAGFILAATVPGIVLSLLGPFGSFLAPVTQRLAFWMPTMAMGALLGAGLTMLAQRSPTLRVRPFMRTLLLATMMTILMSGVVWALGHIVFGPGAIKFSPYTLFYVWLITVLMVGTVAAIRANRAAELASPVAQLPLVNIGIDDTNGFQVPLVRRLSPRLKMATILALEAEDHYVRIHTDQGSELILMRLADAIDETGGVSGARTHRSWWVARQAVTEIRRSDGRATLVLANGTQAPVSRNAVSELVEKGWL